jgi:hypothetical protein
VRRLGSPTVFSRGNAALLNPVRLLRPPVGEGLEQAGPGGDRLADDAAQAKAVAAFLEDVQFGREAEAVAAFLEDVRSGSLAFRAVNIIRLLATGTVLSSAAWSRNTGGTLSVTFWSGE